MPRCRKCGKTLTNPVSIEIGMGAICRMSNKLMDKNEKTENMFASRSEYDYKLDGNIIAIEDRKGMKSVTNDIENVLSDIMKLENTNSAFFTDKRIIYKDSDGIWDEVRLQIEERGIITKVTFHPITEMDYEKAKAKINSKEKVEEQTPTENNTCES